MDVQSQVRADNVLTSLVNVHDNFLDDTSAEKILAWLDGLNFKSVHVDGWRSVWRLTEASVLRGPSWSVNFAGDLGPEGPIPPPLCVFAERLRRLVLPDDPDWYVSLTPWIYPVGSGLGLHRDDQAYRGAFSYYLTREWDIHWGGLLLAVGDSPNACVPRRSVFDARVERQSVSDVGQGSWIVPAWNRLVFIPPDVRHCVTRVDAAAGDRPRITIAGFVHRRPTDKATPA